MDGLHLRTPTSSLASVMSPPNGRSTNLSDGLVRLRLGDVTESADGSLTARISMMPMANTFRRGHRIRLQVSSGAHPLVVRNTGSDEPIGSTAQLRVADREKFHDTHHPSRITLPVSHF
jgi:predicted acyl esterase